MVLRDGDGSEQRYALNLRAGQRDTVVDFSRTTLTEGPLWPGATLLGVGLAGGVAGAIVGGLALADANAVKNNCIDTDCLASDQERAERARNMATASTALFIASGALTTAGIVLLVVRPGGGDTAVGVSAQGAFIRGRF